MVNSCTLLLQRLDYLVTSHSRNIDYCVGWLHLGGKSIGNKLAENFFPTNHRQN
jgi:hypothetical protein